jgi:putative ABC transport system permease protein
MLPLRYNIRSLQRRKARTLLTAAGIGVAVFVSVTMLALAFGLMNSIRDTGHPLNVVVTSRGAETIEFSAIDRRVLDVLRFSPHVAIADEQPLASPELFFTTLIETGPGAASQALVRGVLPAALAVHDQVRIVQGRFPDRAGEIMAGALAATKIGMSPSGIGLGQTLDIEGSTWRIVGLFAAPGTAFESEIWGPLDEIMTATRREELSSIVLRARDSDGLEEMLFDFELRTDVLVTARKEVDYYAAYAGSYRPVLLMVYAMTGMLVFGGLFIGMNTLFAAIMGRVREVGVLRIVGYRRWQIAVAFVIESMIPAMAGGLVAGLLALCLNGLPLRIPMGAFRLQVDAQLVAVAVMLSVLIGLLGAAWPVWLAVRLRAVDAIRQL